MAATELEILRDEQERANLRRAVSDLEIANAVSNPNTRRILERSLDGAKSRITSLDKKIDEAKIEHAAEVQVQFAAAPLAAKETALSASERETYRDFLEKSYFTKKDFGKLDEFYQHSYDRLSEGGKDEMSKRIHEGIRRGEFKESDLSRPVKERYEALSHEHSHIKIAESNNRTPDADDQSRAYNGASSASDNKLISDRPTPSTANETLDLSAVDLKGVKLVTTNAEPTVVAMLDATGSRATGRA